MAKKIAELVVELTANMANFQRDLSAARKDVKEFGDSVTGTFGKIESIVTTGLQAFGAYAAFEHLNRLTESIENMGHAAQKAGVDVQQFSALSFAAKMMNVDSDTLTMGLARLSKAMVSIEQSARGQAAGASLQALGISAKNAAGEMRPTEQVLLDMADRFAKMKDGAEKTGLAMQVFGRGGTAMIPMLNLGREGLRAYIEEANASGLRSTKRGSKRPSASSKVSKLLHARFEGLQLQFAQGLLPSLNNLLSTFSRGEGQLSTFAAAGQAVGSATAFIARGFIDLAFDIDRAVIKVQSYWDHIRRRPERRHPAVHAHEVRPEAQRSIGGLLQRATGRSG